MKLPKVIASTPPPTDVGAARATDIRSLTDVGPAGQGFQAVGQVVSKIAGAGLDVVAARKKKRQELDDQVFSGEASKRASGALTEAIGTWAEYDPIANNQDPRDVKNYYDGTKITGINNQMKEEFSGATYKTFRGKILSLSKGFKDPEEQQAFINKWDVDGFKGIGEAGNKKHNDYHEELFLNNARDAASNGDLELSNLWLDIAEKNGLIGLKTFNAEKEKNRDILGESLVNQTHAAIQAGNLAIAEVLADNSVIPEKQQTVLRNKIEGAKKEVDNAAREVDRDKLGKALHNGTISYPMIDKTILDETEQETYRVRMETEARRSATGKPIATNQSVKGDIEAEAYKIWMGAVRQDDYVEILENARYGVKVDDKFRYSFGNVTSDKPLIDDNAYDELRTIGTTQLKQSQAKGLSESSFYAKGQLVEVTDDLAFAKLLEGMDKPQKETVLSERKLQLENWSQFNRSMKLWQADNDEAVEGDYYLESRKKLPFYRGRTEESISQGELPTERVPFVGPLQGITATNQTTGERQITYDGGKTWQKLQ